METSGLSDGVRGHWELEGQRGSDGASCIDSFFLERKSLTERLLGRRMLHLAERRDEYISMLKTT